MRKSVMRRGLGLGASIALAAGLALTAAPAQASKRPIDITGYKVSDITVGDSNCRSLNVTASTRVENDYVGSLGIIDITRRAGLVGNLLLDGRQIASRATICPALSGLGAYKVGPADLEADYEYYDSDIEGYASDYSTYTDNTSKTFNVRGKTKSTLSAKRSGSTVPLKAEAQVYTPDKFRYARYNATGVKLQVKSGSKWKTLKTVKLKSGKASVTLKQTKKKTYRLYIPKTSWAASNTSKSVSK